MVIMFIKRNSTIIPKSTLLLLLIFVVSTNSSYCQSTNSSQSVSIERFQGFIKLFRTITDTDSVLVNQQITYTTYPQKLIDTFYYSFVHLTPYFYPYAVFKVERPNGFLVCVRHDCPAERADLQFVEFITFDFNGTLQNRVLLPLRKYGCLTDTYYDETEISVSNSLLQIQIERIFYGKSESSILKNMLYHINHDGNIITISD